MYSLIIVEDEDKIRNSIKNLIDWKDMGFEVVSDFEDGIEALEFLKNHTVDVILTDIKMNQLSGVELACELRKTNQETHIIFLSGFKEFEYARNAIEYSVEGYLLKPIKLNELYRVFSTLRDKLDAARVKKALYGKPAWSISNRDASEQYDCDPELDENKLLEYVFQGDIEAVEGLILKIIENIMSLEAKESNIKNRLISFMHDIITRINDTVTGDIKLQDFDYSLIYLAGSLAEVRQTIIGYFLEASAYFKNNRIGTDRLIIHKVKDYIKQHYADEISLNSAAELVYLSPNYLSKVFKEYAGENFIDYLTRVRIEKAKIQLKNNDAKVYEVAESVGYKSQKYFSRLFKECTGMSPTEYQNSRDL